MGMKCPLDAQRKARGHKDGVQAKDLGKTEAGAHLALRRCVWNGTETRECQWLRKCQGEARREAGKRSHELVSLKPKEKKASM